MRTKETQMNDSPKSPTRFRVHVAGGHHDVTADSPTDARAMIKARDPAAHIVKVKELKADEA